MPTLTDRLCDELALDPTSRAAVDGRVANGTAVAQALLDVGDDEAVAQAFASMLGLRVAMSPTELVPEANWLTRVPLRVWAAARALPLKGAGGADDPTVMAIAVADPLDAAALDAVRVASGGLLPEVVVAPRRLLLVALREHLGVGADTVQSLVEGKGEEASAEVDLADAAEDASIIRLVNQVLQEALERRATDVHFEPFEGRYAVRYRVDGILVEAKLPAEVRRLQAAIVSRLKILASLDIAEKRLPQDGRIKLRLAGREVDVRVSIIPMLHGEAVVLRLLDRSAALVGLVGTGMGGRDLQMFQHALDLPHGIVLVTGPTGSGKTTSLYAGLSRINTPDLKIVTIEDPVEYHLDGINQIQVDGKTGLTFAKGLRAILRHDPDVVLIGEIRDRETAEIAVQASLTGHLVLSTLHTNDAPGAVARLVDMGIEPYLVASTLELVVAQRLVRLLCVHCKRELSGAERDDALTVLPGHSGTLYGPVGCRECNGTGYSGRSGIFKSMAMSAALRHASGEHASGQALREVAVQEGLVSLRDDGLRLAREGKTSVVEVLRNTHSGTLGR
ncbi:MAG TPA: GspE/PulE family protein [Planctomycetota bacterium]|nr:GspE/PulE family protein [Planctomycetota bacterium]